MSINLNTCKKAISLLLSLFMMLSLFIFDYSLPAYAEEPQTYKTIVVSDTAWRYLDDNSDPFLTTTLYQVGQMMGYGDALNAYRNAWALPYSPYSDPSLNALAGTTDRKSVV